MYKRILLITLLVVLGAGTALLLFRFRHLSSEIFLSPLATSEIVLGETSVPTDFSIENAPSDSLRGRIATMSGEIFWQSRIATESARLLKPITLQQGEVLHTGDDGKIVVAFEKLAGLIVNERSKVELTQTLSLSPVFNQFSGGIEYTASGNVPVSVRVGWLLVTLMKGSVVVDMDPDEGMILVTLVDGVATAAYNNIDFETQVIELTVGKEYEFDNVVRDVR